ncbi:hypothetical protein DFS34DRAFT_629841 [Phlyctochytrium arcticum]|nr:hypothetical protein DFS34DRAFT_629841 [Phlyctochytrium arcticum]
MARQRRSAAPSRPAAQRTQTRPATTAASHPPAHQAPPAPPAVQQGQPRQPGMFAQMATTAAGVAVGSAVGHTLGAGLTGMFGGGGSSAPAPQAEGAPVQQQYTSSQNFNQDSVNTCAPDQKAFLRCLDVNSNDINACQFYLDMLKQCQASAQHNLQ